VTAGGGGRAAERAKPHGLGVQRRLADCVRSVIMCPASPGQRDQPHTPPRSAARPAPRRPIDTPAPLLLLLSFPSSVLELGQWPGVAFQQVGAHGVGEGGVCPGVGWTRAGLRGTREWEGAVGCGLAGERESEREGGGAAVLLSPSTFTLAFPHALTAPSATSYRTPQLSACCEKLPLLVPLNSLCLLSLPDAGHACARLPLFFNGRPPLRRPLRRPVPRPGPPGLRGPAC